jgi:hypothetical protein
MAAVGKSKVADAARCRRHPGHRHAAGVCPFCLSDRLSRLSAAVKAANDASSSTASSPRSSGGQSVASAPPPCRRARLGMLMRQEETDSAAAGGRHDGQEKAPAPAPTEEKKPAKRSNFWARLQQGRSWYRKDGCSLAHSKAAAGEKTAKRAPLF